jgi:hypothetical protein
MNSAIAKLGWRAGLASLAMFLVVLLTEENAQAEPHMHDGFIAQVGLSVGYARVSDEVKQAGFSEEYKYTGVAGALDVLFGGTVFPGLALGAGLTTRVLVDPTVETAESTGEASDVALSLDTITSFVQWYPDAAGGLFLRGQVGYGSGSIAIDDITYDSHTSGLVLGAAVGYEWWVAREWSIGMEGQLVTAFLNGSEDGVGHDVVPKWSWLRSASST